MPFFYWLVYLIVVKLRFIGSILNCENDGHSIKIPLHSMELILGCICAFHYNREQ